MLISHLRLAFALMLGALFAPALQAQETVRPVAYAESLFTSPDPKLHANKQVVYAIIRELLEAGQWDPNATCSTTPTHPRAVPAW